VVDVVGVVVVVGIVVDAKAGVDRDTRATRPTMRGRWRSRPDNVMIVHNMG
jgi:hypothetical protein